MNKLIEILEKILLKENIAIKDLESYENYFADNSDSIESELSQNIFSDALDFQHSCGFYEPNEELRKDDKNYFDERELRKKIEKLLMKLKRSEE